MRFRPCRFLSALAIVVVAIALCQARAEDEVKERLFQAKKKYDSEVQKFRDAVVDHFDKREEIARKNGDKKSVDQIKVERRAFEEVAELPKSLPAEVKSRLASARTSLEAAYKSAVQDYTKTKQDDEAAAVEKELDEFKKRRSPPFVDDLDTAFPWRTNATKKRLIEEYGGNEASERAVALGLAWLAKQQKADGSWVYDVGSIREVTAATGMALLAFLGAGETHVGDTKYQNNVQKGLNWLASHLQAKAPNAGKFDSATTMYAQAIGTLALCEAYGMTKDKKLLAHAQSAINYILKAQGPNGSWGYTAGTNGDTSIVGWQIQALLAARLSKDIKVADAAIRKAVKFLDFASSGSRKAAYGYIDNKGAAPGTSVTSVGLLCRYNFDGWGPDNAGMAEGVLGLMKRSPGAETTKPALDMYFYYYATQVVRYFEGDEWRSWNDGPKKADGSRSGGMRDWLIDLQNQKEGVNEGSWDPDPGFIGKECGRIGTTALCVLTLEVYYRYRPHKKDDK